jgi:large subunit ribosomal protein L4
MKVTSINSSDKFTTITVSDVVFGSSVNKSLLSQAIRVYLSNKRQGSSKVKSRGEVKRTKRKMYKQKGTGNARHGARSAPIFVGGGVAHGPTGLSNWSLDLSRKMKKKALISALSAQVENIIVVDTLPDTKGKTKNAAKFLNKVKALGKKVLIITDDSNQEFIRALNNIASCIVMKDDLVNALDVVSADILIMSKSALKNIEARLVNKEKEIKAEVKAEVKVEAKPKVKSKAKPKAKPKTESKTKTVAKKIKPKSKE